MQGEPLLSCLSFNFVAVEFPNFKNHWTVWAGINYLRWRAYSSCVKRHACITRIVMVIFGIIVYLFRKTSSRTQLRSFMRL